MVIAVSIVLSSCEIGSSPVNITITNKCTFNIKISLTQTVAEPAYSLFTTINKNQSKVFSNMSSGFYYVHIANATVDGTVWTKSESIYIYSNAAWEISYSSVNGTYEITKKTSL